MESGRHVSPRQFFGEWCGSPPSTTMEAWGVGDTFPSLAPHCGSALGRADIWTVRFKKEIEISFSKVRREMGKVLSHTSVEG